MVGHGVDNAGTDKQTETGTTIVKRWGDGLKSGGGADE